MVLAESSPDIHPRSLAVLQASIPDVPERHVIMSLYGHGVVGGRL